MLGSDASLGALALLAEGAHYGPDPFAVPAAGVLTIILASIFTNNILLANFLGMCTFIGLSNTIKAAAGMGLAVIFVSTLSITICWPIYYYVLVPAGLEYLQFICFITTIAALVQFVEMFTERFSPALYASFGLFLPLIAVNCAILGVCVFMVARNYDFAQTVAFGVGGGLGWALAILSLAGIRVRVKFSNVPKPAQGFALTMAIIGVMGMAVMGFAGMVNIQ
jgi:Na+-transporting NADH:ubiquinone oxidoreductase subunit E